MHALINQCLGQCHRSLNSNPEIPQTNNKCYLKRAIFPSILYILQHRFGKIAKSFGDFRLFFQRSIFPYIFESSPFVREQAIHLFFLTRILQQHTFCLKVPKREIFDRSDFPDFYRIRSSWVGDLDVKILT
jgi:hypothetical protein